MEGCGWPLDKVEKLIKGDVETLAMWRDAVTPPAGRPSLNGDIITNNEDGRGTSKSYTVFRLRREAPELYEEVKEGRLSANAAAIQAGFRKKPSPFEQITRLLSKLTSEERRQLKELLS